MDVTKILESDHRKVEALFDKIETAGESERTPLIEELTTSLHAHMALEEATLYPAMKPVTGDETFEEANQEHELARAGLAQMVGLAPDEPGFDGALEAVKAGIKHHVGEEEDEIFPKLRKDGSALERVATPFMKKRVELGMPIDGDALAASSTKDELLGEAEAANVEGARTMSKAELADALVAQMG